MTNFSSINAATADNNPKDGKLDKNEAAKMAADRVVNDIKSAFEKNEKLLAECKQNNIDYNSASSSTPYLDQEITPIQVMSSKFSHAMDSILQTISGIAGDKTPIRGAKYEAGDIQKSDICAALQDAQKQLLTLPNKPKNAEKEIN